MKNLMDVLFKGISDLRGYNKYFDLINDFRTRYKIDIMVEEYEYNKLEDIKQFIINLDEITFKTDLYGLIQFIIGYYLISYESLINEDNSEGKKKIEKYLTVSGDIFDTVRDNQFYVF